MEIKHRMDQIEAEIEEPQKSLTTLLEASHDHLLVTPPSLLLLRRLKVRLMCLLS